MTPRLQARVAVAASSRCSWRWSSPPVAICASLAARRLAALHLMIEQMAARAGASVATADGAGEGTTPEAAMLRRIVDVFAVYERDVIRGRTRAAMAAKRGRGERVSRFAPYGFELDQGGELVPQPAELAALRCAGELAAAGVPLRRIGAELERAGHRPRGRAWHLTTVARLVRRAQAGFEGSKAA